MKRIEDKMRKQQLVAEKRVSPDKSSDDIMKGVRQRPKFMAQQVTKELVLNGRLP